jgi:hypothetical protein
LPGLRVLARSRTPDPGFGKTPLPAPHRRPADPDAVGNLLGGCPIRRSKHDPGPRRVFLPPVAVGHDRLQLFPIQSADNHRCCLSHLASIAHSKLPLLWIRRQHRFDNAIDGSPGRG